MDGVTVEYLTVVQICAQSQQFLQPSCVFGIVARFLRTLTFTILYSSKNLSFFLAFNILPKS